MPPRAPRPPASTPQRGQARAAPAPRPSPPRRARLGAALAALLLVQGTPLRAAPPAPAEPAAPAPPEDQRLAAARAHYERGEALYRERDYGAAWLEFSSAHQITPLLELLFNMARCEARTRRPREALAHFRAYLAARPEDPEAPAIRKEMAALESQVRGAPPEPPTSAGPAGPAAPARDPLALPPPLPPPLWRKLPIFSMAGLGAGVVLLGAGGASLGVGQWRGRLLDGRCGASCSDEERAAERGPTTAGFALLGIGAAVTLTAAILLPIELRSRRAALQVSLAPGPGPAVQLAGRF